jgi:hypothetical protein
MTPRIAALLAASALLAPLPALAQALDFGDDTSVWANDGECDDPRFEGSGVSPSAIDLDILHDASDCRAAFEAGTATLVGGPIGTAPQPGGKGGDDGTEAPVPLAVAGAVDFGDDSSRWARDGECDDRRFVGAGMATSIGWANVGRDATDCRSLYESGQVSLWDAAAAAGATQCAAITFGDDTSQYANNGECDDIRFEGLGSAAGLNEANTGHDAADCRQLCTYGLVSVRDY